MPYLILLYEQGLKMIEKSILLEILAREQAQWTRDRTRWPQWICTTNDSATPRTRAAPEPFCCNSSPLVCPRRCGEFQPYDRTAEWDW